MPKGAGRESSQPEVTLASAGSTTPPKRSGPNHLPVDAGSWFAQIIGALKYYERFGDRVPKALTAEVDTLCQEKPKSGCARQA